MMVGAQKPEAAEGMVEGVGGRRVKSKKKAKKKTKKESVRGYTEKLIFRFGRNGLGSGFASAFAHVRFRGTNVHSGK